MNISLTHTVSDRNPIIKRLGALLSTQKSLGSSRFSPLHQQNARIPATRNDSGGCLPPSVDSVRNGHLSLQRGVTVSTRSLRIVKEVVTFLHGHGKYGLSARGKSTNNQLHNSKNDEFKLKMVEPKIFTF